MPYGTVNADTLVTSTSGGILGAGNASIMKNRIINGAMQISQRYGTTNTAVGTGNYVIDRWSNYKQSSTGAYSVQQSSASQVAGFTYSNLITITTASNDTGSTVNAAQQYIEGNNCGDLGWGTANAKTVTLSFWAKSSLTGNFSVCIQNASFNRSFVSTYSLPTANTWTYCTITIAGETTGTWATDNTAGIGVWFDVGSGDGYATASTNSWLSSTVFRATGSTKLMATNGATLNITGVQLEVGSSATGFEYRQFGTELQLCQRYYESTAFPDASFGITSCRGSAVIGGGGSACGFNFLVPKRTNAPTVTLYSRSGNAGKVSNNATGGDLAGTSSASAIGGTGFLTISMGTALTAGACVEAGWTSSAEL
jgi:hypothetical protein